MTEDRRNDIGNKVIISVLAGVILLLITFFVNSTWVTANEGKNTANEVKTDVVYLKARFDNFYEDFSEIKELLKRKIPNG